MKRFWVDLSKRKLRAGTPDKYENLPRHANGEAFYESDHSVTNPSILLRLLHACSVSAESFEFDLSMTNTPIHIHLYLRRFQFFV